MFRPSFKPFALAACLSLFAACGTTYQLAEIDGPTASRATAMFQAAASEGARPPAPPSVARARFDRVVARVRPAAEALCAEERKSRPSMTCTVPIGIDIEMPVRNAYFTYADPATKRQPRIMVTIPLLRDVRNDDELAFVLAHEYGHLLGQHIEKAEAQAVAGALLLGVVVAAATADPYVDNSQIVSDSVQLGGAIGQRAFSQTYELESDTIGTFITMQAGYDPIRGAGYFARPDEVGQVNGALSFWGTHPPDEKRIATVIATAQQVQRQGGIARKAR
ncbi:M48 family metalloprotease [Jannaschia formosa]|uniref:M48 family metalloprotease n=1 Tax=Jannaschia formosa TaxID=2259592 RepID=UPI001FD84B6B|nr:M48 family metalloprotease [Jannaschia formosa]